jgi:fructose-bisphosphate aldolase/6-deoxy-5-ketofructose 1-phosphate synthase
MVIPLSVPASQEKRYQQNMDLITKKSIKRSLFLFAADQKIEHLHTDFFGQKITPEAENPEHLFKIASQASIGAFTTHFGLIARYGRGYPDIPYIVKLNGKSNLIPLEQQDPRSKTLQSVEDLQVLTDRVNVVGVGYTIYLGSEYEAKMLHEAAQMIVHAHAQGLITVLWIYPRGKALEGKNDPLLAAGATGLGLSLGADFVKIAAPKELSDLEHAVHAAGNTGVICSGGTQQEKTGFTQAISAQLAAGARGCAVGRNIFQRPESEAIDLCNTISALVYK